MPGSTQDTPSRRSGRKRKISQRYGTSSVFNDEEVFGPSEPLDNDSVDEAEDEDFEAVVQNGDENIDGDEDPSDGDSSTGAHSADAQDADEEISDALSDSGTEQVAGATKKSRRGGRKSLVERAKKAKIPARDDQIRSQGLKQFAKSVQTDVHLFYYFGQSQEDAAPLLEAKTLWAEERTLPSRKHDIRFSPFVPEATRLRDREDAWDWYYNGPGKARFEKLQYFTAIDGIDDLHDSSDLRSTSFFGGGLPDQSLFNLPATRSLSLSDIWEKDNTGSDNNPARGGRHGWLVNIGESVRGVAWAPNQPGPKQYLAVYSRTEPSLGRNARMKSSTTYSSAFTAGSTEHSILQLWEFCGQKASGHQTMTTDNSEQPRLAATLHANYGFVKSIQWCPMLRGSETSIDTAKGQLGMLAMIHSDGGLRILDIRLDQFRDKHMRLLQVAFHSQPPDTVCTCMSWLSSALIAAGCANGYVAIWDLEQHLKQDSPSPNATPRFYYPFHDSYVMNITPCFPSRPHLIVSSSIDGHLRLTDIRSPLTEHVYGQRTRSTIPIMQWYEQAQHLISADDTYNLRAAMVRKFDRISYVDRYHAPISSLASSPVHPSVLVGLADGIVKVFNPMSRLLRPKKAMQHYDQVWFRHDWRKGQSNADHDSSETRADEQSESHKKNTIDFPCGITRLTSGYKVELSTSKGPKPKPEGSKKTGATGSMRIIESGTMWTTTYEKETGINCLAWNPNISAGGWAAAGMGSGLLWIEDLAYN